MRRERCSPTATLASTAAGVWLSTRPEPFAWAAGQAVLAASLVEWFVILHECGHHTLFRGRALNAIVGHIAGFFALIPFGMWVQVHGVTTNGPAGRTSIPRPRRWRHASVRV